MMLYDECGFQLASCLQLCVRHCEMSKNLSYCYVLDDNDTEQEHKTLALVK